MSGEPPTAAQMRVYNFVAAFTVEHGYAPTTREIQDGLGFASQTAAVSHLRALRSKGRVTWQKGKARTLKVHPDINPEADLAKRNADQVKAS